MKIRFALALIALSAPATAAPALYECPKEIQANQQLASPAGAMRVFIDRVNVRHYLSGVDLYDGPPEQLAILKPDNAETEDTSATYWTTNGNPNLYVVCSYNDTSVKLTQQIALTAKRCEVAYVQLPEDGPELPALKGMNCE